MRLTRKNKQREFAAVIERGRGLIGEGKDQEALEFLDKAARDFPKAAEFPLMLATIYRDSRPDDVPAQLTKAAELGSDDPVIQVMVGHRLLNEGDVEAARACAARAGDLIDEEFPLTADFDRLIGRIAARDGDDVAAEARLRSAFRREPELPTHSLDLARFLWARGRNEDALAVIDESLDQVSESDRDLLERLRGEISGDTSRQ
jgi:Flp pilus assembly protein TadD